MMRAALLCALTLAFAGSSAAQVLAPDPKNRVSFSVDRTREVANDWATALVGTSDEDTDAARLADRVNKAIDGALAVAKQAKGVEVKSGGYQTNPITDEKGKITRWSASQDLILESGDVDALSALIGKLQAKQLLLRSITFSVSPETRRKTEDAMIGDALTAFQERAKKITAGLGARDYEIVSLSLNSGGGSPVPMYARAEMAMDKFSPPRFESGQSTLTTRVDATIEIDK